MAMLQSVTKFGKKFEAGTKGILGTAAGGIGTNTLMRTVDNATGGNVQRIFSINLPFIGQTGLIDALTYVVYANGLKISKRGAIALIAAKMVQGVIPSLGNISVPGFGGNLAQQSSTASGVTGGPQ